MQTLLKGLSLLRWSVPVGLVLAGVASLAPVFSPSAAAATTWHMVAGDDNRNEGIQITAFLPDDITIRAGDTITWTVRSGEFHTVSFLSGGARPDVVVGGGFNPTVAAPAGGSSYDGTGYVNSGLLLEDQTYTLTFPTAGNYDFYCLIHSEMKGQLHVLTPRQALHITQADYDREIASQRRFYLDDGRNLLATGLAASASSGSERKVTAGIGDKLVFIARFQPQRIVIQKGDTVVWTNLDPETPHTVTFGAEPPGGPFGSFPPIGGDGPGHGTISDVAQAVNSGFLGPDFPFGTAFAVKFATAGLYPYICALHDELGMVGTVVVQDSHEGKGGHEYDPT